LRLLEWKARLPHGQWRAWVRAHFPLSLRTAQHWMALTRRYQLIRRLKAATETAAQERAR